MDKPKTEGAKPNRTKNNWDLSEIEEFEFEHPVYNGGYMKHNIGKFVSIRPCAPEYENKTFLGIYLGDLPVSVGFQLLQEEKTLKAYTHTNPAIFIPDINKIIFGNNSWWTVISDPEKLKKITDETIDNVWYVKAMKSINDPKKPKSKTD